MKKVLLLVCLLLACGEQYTTTSQAISSYTVLHDLTQAEGQAVRGQPLIVNGRLYGVAGEHGPNASPDCASGTNWDTDVHKKQCPGSVFSMLLDGTDFRVDHAFSQLDSHSKNTDGYHPYAGLSYINGRLYGVTSEGGMSPGCASTTLGKGVLYSMGLDGSDFRVDHYFCSLAGAVDGTNPYGYVIELPDGAIIGTTNNGGASPGLGTVWRLDSAGFYVVPMNSSTGGNPRGGAALGPDGLLYVMTNGSSTNGRGAVVVLTQHLEILEIHPFEPFTTNSHGTDNSAVQEPVVIGGRVLAAREFGGPYGTGLVVDMTDGLVTLKSFEDIPLAAVPRFSNTTGGMLNGNLVEGADGLVYGTSMYGGSHGAGNIYRIAKNGSLFESLFNFPTTPGRAYGGVALGPDGSLYGITFSGNEVFRFVPPTVSQACE